MSQVKALRFVSEGARERETFKYHPTLQTTSRYNDSGEAIPSNELKTSSDTVLTALAQLCACQTGTGRAVVSLFDAGRQHIVAEASPSQPLYSSVPGHECASALWLCGTSIPRAHGVCELALLGKAASEPHAREPSEPADLLPLTLSPDLTVDPRFQTSPFCKPGSLARFYAAVPIRSRRGINIGVLCVMDPTPGREWSDEQTTRLREISQAIMGHLESQRLQNLQERSARMSRGMASFIEGKPPVVDLDYRSDEANHTVVKPDHDQVVVEDEESRPGLLSDTESSSRIFSKAASVITESVGVDGCFFYDATVESYRKPSTLGSNSAPSSGRASAASSSDESLDAGSGHTWPCSQVLGFSTSGDVNPDGAAASRADIAEPFLGKLMRRYPTGKIFNFGDDGELQSSDSSEDGETGLSTLTHPNNREQHASHSTQDKSPGNECRRKAAKKLWSRKNEGHAIREVFPNARSVAFVPIWDPKKERWYAGGFIYTKDSSRALTILEDLGYLRAFGTLAMVEVLRLRMSRADKAKSDVLGSLSHELRSPLHGILLSAELLLDTELDVFQGNTAHTIETCSRTLLDTIDHLLDYSKVNNFAGMKKPRQGSQGSSTAVTGVDWKNFGKKSLLSHCRVDALVEEVVESVFAGYTFQHASTPKSAGVGLDELRLQALPCDAEELHIKFADVSVFFFVDPSCDWMHCVQVGAFRRIVMNIFGNALKYTHRGYVRVYLTQDTVSVRRRKAERVIRFKVQDTGKGIGSDYLKHGLFKPFSQEDSLAPGTGLGLSLVKRITSQLGGQVTVESQVGLGTTVTVELPLEPMPKTQASQYLSEDDKEFDESLEDLKGLRVKTMCSLGSCDNGHNSCHRSQLEEICVKWLHMDIISDAGQDIVPDLIIWTHEALPKKQKDIKMLAQAPNIVLCANALEAYHQSQSFDSEGHFGIFEFISQPIGPRKLAKTLLLAYRRWMDPRWRRSTTEDAPLSVQRPVGPKMDSSSNVMLDPEHAFLPIRATASPQNDSTSGTEDESVFSAELSANDTPASSSETLSSASEQGSSQAASDSTPGTHFLLVDDNHINLKLLSAYMKKTNLEHHTAVNGKEALDTYTKASSTYACILMDISMPVMDGFEATRQIRAYEQQHGLERVCIIALSGLASEDAQLEAFGSGMDLFLSKPVKMKALEGLLEERGILKGKARA